MSEGGTNAPSRHSTDSLDPAPFIPLLRMGDRLSIHCMYTNLVDVALLDTLIEHNVQFIMNRLRGDCEQYRDEIKEGVREVASSLRNLVDMRLLRQAELSVQDLFVRHPLFEVLDPMTLAEDSVSNHSKIIQAKEQQLTVLILGCGDHGIEALKTSFWLGRIARTQLKIVVVDNCDVRQKMEHLFLSSPEMMTERTYSEDVRGPHVGTWSIARRHRTPTVRFCEMDVYGVQMRALLNGEEVRTLWYTDDPKPSIAESTEVVVGNNDHLYCLICLDNDDAELKLALGLQQCLAARKLHAYNEDEASAPVSGRIGDLVPIAIHLRSESILTSEETGEWGPQSGLRNLGFPLYQFGSAASTFTYEALAGNELEEQAIQINALPTLVRHERISHRKGEMDYHGITELAKYRHRSVALSIPYKLWMLGFEPGKVSSRDFQHRLCPGLDSSEIDKADKRFNRSADAAFRAKHPLFAYMGDLEHVRWCAFYRTLGWRDATVMPEKARSLISFDEGASNMDLALCYYLCDDKDELCQRAEKHGDHPHAYGRMLVWHSIDVLNGTVCQK